MLAGPSSWPTACEVRPDRWALVNLPLFRSMLGQMRTPTPGAVIEEVVDQGPSGGAAQGTAADPAGESIYTPSFSGSAGPAP